MAKVVLTGSLSDRFAGGETELDVEASNVRQLLRALEARYPGLGNEIERAQLLAIDGEFYQDPFMQSLNADAEVYVLPKMAGG